jgi:hypothetical protein
MTPDESSAVKGHAEEDPFAAADRDIGGGCDVAYSLTDAELQRFVRKSVFKIFRGDPRTPLKRNERDLISCSQMQFE